MMDKITASLGLGRISGSNVSEPYPRFFLKKKKQFPESLFKPTFKQLTFFKNMVDKTFLADTAHRYYTY